MRDVSARSELRRLTAGAHEAVDAAFARYDLSARKSYAECLAAHGRVLPRIEAALAPVAGLPPLRPRTPLLAADLAALGWAMPTSEPVVASHDIAQAFGMAYVLEGSRLGGGFLARTVPPDLPRAFLTAVHLPGEWRAFGAAMDAACDGDRAWIARAADAALRVFERYAAAAVRCAGGDCHGR